MSQPVFVGTLKASLVFLLCFSSFFFFIWRQFLNFWQLMFWGSPGSSGQHFLFQHFELVIKNSTYERIYVHGTGTMNICTGTMGICSWSRHHEHMLSDRFHGAGKPNWRWRVTKPNPARSANNPRNPDRKSGPISGGWAGPTNPLGDRLPAGRV